MKKILKILLTGTLALTTLFSSVSAAVPTYNMDLITSPSDEKTKLARLVNEQKNVFSGDFNGDGKTDYAAFVRVGPNHSQIYVWHSNGNGFNSPVLYEDLPSYNCDNIKGKIATGDFNGDGKDDFAAVYYYIGYGTTKIHTFLSDGEKFTTPLWYEASPSLFNSNSITDRIVAGDFNGDGKDDLGVIYNEGTLHTSVRILLTNSTATGFLPYQKWYESTAYNAEKTTGKVVAGDFNDDGKDDITLMYDCGSTRAQLQTFYSTGSGFTNNTFTLTYDSGVGNFEANAVTNRMVAADFNNDGKDEIITHYRYSNGSGKIFAWKKDSSGNFGYNVWGTFTSSQYDMNTSARTLTSGDFNGDGKEETAFFGNANISDTSISSATKNVFYIRVHKTNSSSNGYIDNSYLNYFNCLSMNIHQQRTVYAAPEDSGVAIGTLSPDTNVQILSVDAFYRPATAFDPTPFTERYYYIEFASSAGIVRGYVHEDAFYSFKKALPSIVPETYYRSKNNGNNKIVSPSFFNIIRAYHGPSTSYKSFDDAIPSDASVKILDIVRYDGSKYWYWVEYKAPDGLKRGFVSSNSNAVPKR